MAADKSFAKELGDFYFSFDFIVAWMSQSQLENVSYIIIHGVADFFNKFDSRSHCPDVLFSVSESEVLIVSGSIEYNSGKHCHLNSD